MTLIQITTAIYSGLLTNYYGFKLKLVSTGQEKKKLRTAYSYALLNKLDIHVKLLNPEKLPKNGQFLLISNHKSVIDPLIIELATKESEIFGYWIAKKELYKSFFFGMFVRNAGTILLDRESSQMSSFFSDIKKCVIEGNSIYIFPEGTRNKGKEVIAEFKEGSRIIAMKNKLPILPLYIRTNANEALMSALKYRDKSYIIEVECGDIIDYKDRSISLNEAYKKQFSI